MSPELQPEPHDALGRRLTRTLESAPTFSLPHDFASRTALLAATRFGPVPSVAGRDHRFSTLATRLAFAACILAMLVLAPAARSHGLVPVTVEMLFTFEFVALAIWFSLRPLQG